MRVRRSQYRSEAAELNITAFLNLMVILVPFLLITAVFSRMTILQLNLPPADGGSEKSEEVDLQLQLLIRENSFDVRDANLGLIRRFERTQSDTDWQGFSDLLVTIKNRFPDETAITLLMEPSVNYKTLISVMDRVRSADIVQAASLETIELFPDISIGDAPALPDKSLADEPGESSPAASVPASPAPPGDEVE